LEAESIDPFAPAAARAKRDAAQRLLRAATDSGNEILSISVVAGLRGRNYESTRRLVSDSEELNAGGRHAPAIRRRDLDKIPPGRASRLRHAAARDTASDPDARSTPVVQFDVTTEKANRGSPASDRASASRFDSIFADAIRTPSTSTPPSQRGPEAHRKSRPRARPHADAQTKRERRK
jgi:hypothetical protein